LEAAENAERTRQIQGIKPIPVAAKAARWDNRTGQKPWEDKPVPRIGILDDYLDIVLQSADWSALPDDCEVEVFNEPIPPEQAAQRLGNFDILIATRERMGFPAAVVERLPKLKLLVTTGMNNRAIDLEACRKKGITVCGTPSSPGSTLELSWALILGLVKHIPLNNQVMHSADGWQARQGETINGKTFGILGLGKIGSASVPIAKAFGMDIIAWSPNLTPERCAKAGVRYADKETFFRTADVITIHMVLVEKTKHLVGAKDLALMKPTAYLVNTSRGPLIDESAMVEALKAGRIAGAGFDVYDKEPLPARHPYRDCKNALLTGHMGYYTQENSLIVYPAAIENINAWLAGKPVRVLT
jgi:phosphoglycerate dehydrogenase-like enzyme